MSKDSNALLGIYIANSGGNASEEKSFPRSLKMKVMLPAPQPKRVAKALMSESLPLYDSLHRSYQDTVIQFGQTLVLMF